MLVGSEVNLSQALIPLLSPHRLSNPSLERDSWAMRLRPRTELEHIVRCPASETSLHFVP